MTGNGHIVMGEAHEAAKRLKDALWRGYGVDPAGVNITVGIENNGEITLNVGVDQNVPRQPPPELPEFEGFRCKLVHFDGVNGAQQQTSRIKRSMYDG